MPGFTLNLAVMPPLTPWIDPRLNSNPRRPQGFWQWSGSSPFIVEAVVGGVVAPLDSDPVLAGASFSAVLSMYSGGAPPSLVQFPGRKSRLLLSFTGVNRGHHVVLLSLLPALGGIQIPVDYI